jgi:hypothetical protein
MVGGSLSSPEDRNRSSLQNVVFSKYLEFQAVDKAYKSSDPEYYATLLLPYAHTP